MGPLFRIGLLADQRSKQFLTVGRADRFHELPPADFLFERSGLRHERLQCRFYLRELRVSLLE
jgi:hypothetical protein